ncbi:MAG TPA: ABC transporter ATP-binding protein [Acidimicrobiia bacterium]|nr:ABC transporter ATP-binding protein [Acidimicrobiia bacterium]
MAWGGGTITGGAPMGGSVGGSPGNPGNGLPFAGIPSEMRKGVERLLESEPDLDGDARWETQESSFTHRMSESGVSLRRMLRPHKRMLTLSALFIVIEAVCVQAGPFLSQMGIDEGITPHDWTALAIIGTVAILAVVVSAVASGLRVGTTGRFASRVMFELRVRTFAHLQRLSLDYYTDEKAGVIMTRMTSDIESLQQLLQDGLPQFALQGLTMVIVTVVLFFYNVELALITLVMIVPLLTGLSLWFRTSSDRGYERVRDGIANVLSDLSESLAGVRVVTGFNRARRNVLHHRNVSGEYRDANDHTAHLAATYGASTELVGLLGQAALLLIGGNMVRDGNLSVGELAAFLLYLNSFFGPIQSLVQQYNLYQQGQAAIAKLDDLLRTHPSVEEAVDAEPLPLIEGEVTLDDVSFGYDPAKPVLRDVDLHIAAGETIALVGPTGAGKSTIAKLVTRFYDPTDGVVAIDGHDLRDVTIDSLRRQLGVVPQEPFLFMGTMRDNIAFARPDATDDEIMEAVHRVGLTELVERLPEGVDTLVHERGVSLSSGERQLLALARAFLAAPRVLVLDEATSNLDLKSETKVEAGLDAVLEGRTAIIVAHRLSTAMRADRIAVVDDGQILELGTHDELVALGGRYAEMYEAWTAHLDPASADAPEVVASGATG